MTDVYVYMDETGNLDYWSPAGASQYFGFGSLSFSGAHSSLLWDGMRLRAELERGGVRLPNGVHAKHDGWAVRGRVFDELSWHGPRIDVTLLYKPNAYRGVRSKGEMYLYRLAWYLHFKEVAVRVSKAGDHVYVIASSFGTKRRAIEARDALHDVCQQVNRSITLCVWDRASSWGLQLADYALWGVQRQLERGDLTSYDACIRPHLATKFFPWGVHDPLALVRM